MAPHSENGVMAKDNVTEEWTLNQHLKEADPEVRVATIQSVFSLECRF